MTTTFLLVRHASHDLLGRVLAGRKAGVHLSEAGYREAIGVADRLSRENAVAVHSSPRERARETAQPIAERLGLEVEVYSGLDEIDFGEWTGLTFDALKPDPWWQAWNTARSETRCPGGETMVEAQARAVRHIEATRLRYGTAHVILVSHQDVIKSVLAHVLGLSLDCMHRFEVGPASVSAIAIGDWGGKVLSMNEAVPA
jgi:broad specificity phosphatase PhoE